MEKRNVYLLISFLLFIFVFSISSYARIITIVTDPMGTGTYAATAGVAKIINQYNDVDLNVKVKPMTGSLEIAGQLATGEGQLGVHNSFDAKFSWLTKGPEFGVYDEVNKVTPLRLIFGGAITFSTALTHEQTGIKTGADLKGRKFVGEITGGAIDTAQSIAFLKSWGLEKEDVIWMRVPGLTDAVYLLIEGIAEATGSNGPGPAVVNELDAKKGAFFLSINPTPEGIQAFRDNFPWDVDIVEVDPDPRLTGVKEKIWMIKFTDYYMARVDLVSDDEAYGIIKAVWEHVDELRELHSTLNFILEPKYLIIRNQTVPYHPGVIQFFKDQGVWDQELEDQNNMLLDLEAEEM